MSIYCGAIWDIKIARWRPAPGRTAWVNVYAMAVPAFIGTPTRGHGYEKRDPYADFLPPAERVTDEGCFLDGEVWRAVVILDGRRDEKGDGQTTNGQQYLTPLLTLTGREYRTIPFPALMGRLRTLLKIED